jgi:hypothetical protein
MKEVCTLQNYHKTKLLYNLQVTVFKRNKMYTVCKIFELYSIKIMNLVINSNFVIMNFATFKFSYVYKILGLNCVIFKLRYKYELSCYQLKFCYYKLCYI